MGNLLRDKDRLNQCPIHRKNLQKIVCEDCKEIACHECSEKNHKGQNRHTKIFILSTKFLDSYQFQKFVGRGSYGYVLSATKPNSNLGYGIKFIDEVRDAISDAFMEVQILWKLEHPNIIHFYSAELLKDEDRIVIIMELADNSLKNIISHLDEATALHYFLNICKGMQYLHQHKLIHRDIKPDNILIKDGVAKLSDFGLIKRTESSRLSLTDKANLFGTWSYLAPEVLNGKKYNEKCDIWALGIIFHQMLAKGNHLFQGENQEKTKEKILCPDIDLDPRASNFADVIRGSVSSFIYLKHLYF